MRVSHAEYVRFESPICLNSSDFSTDGHMIFKKCIDLILHCLNPQQMVELFPKGTPLFLFLIFIIIIIIIIIILCLIGHSSDSWTISQTENKIHFIGDFEKSNLDMCHSR